VLLVSRALAVKCLLRQ